MKKKDGVENETGKLFYKLLGMHCNPSLFKA